MLRGFALQEADIYSHEITTDEYGNKVSGVTATPTGMYLGWLEQTTATEVTIGQDTQVSDWLLVLTDPAAVVTGRDEIEVEGARYKVVGRPDVKRTYRGPHHVEVRLTFIS